MQMLYDSDAYVVVHIDAHAADDLNTHNRGKAVRNGFEIVHKKDNREVYLDGEWAAAFQQQINAWQANTPTQEEVEEALEGFTTLGHYPLVMH